MILLVGRSCSGKDTIKKELIKLGMSPVITYTTRPQRDGEVDGVDYHFITDTEFSEKKEKGFFAETTSYYVVDDAVWKYGSAVEDLTDDKVMIINPEGLRQIKKIKSLNPVAFYIMADEDTLLERSIARGDDIEEASRRFLADRDDFIDINNYIDFSFRNDIRLKPELLADMILYTYRKYCEVNNH